MLQLLGRTNPPFRVPSPNFLSKGACPLTNTDDTAPLEADVNFVCEGLARLRPDFGLIRKQQWAAVRRLNSATKFLDTFCRGWQSLVLPSGCHLHFRMGCHAVALGYSTWHADPGRLGDFWSITTSSRRWSKCRLTRRIRQELRR